MKSPNADWLLRIAVLGLVYLFGAALWIQISGYFSIEWETVIMGMLTPIVLHLIMPLLKPLIVNTVLKRKYESVRYTFNLEMLAPFVVLAAIPYVNTLYIDLYKKRLLNSSRQAIIVGWADATVRDFKSQFPNKDSDVYEIGEIPTDVLNSIGRKKAACVIYSSTNGEPPHLKLFIYHGFYQIGITVIPLEDEGKRDNSYRVSHNNRSRLDISYYSK